MPRTSSRALSPVEKAAVLTVLHEPRFVDLAPAEVYAGLLDEGRYLCSERTMYRILADSREVRERRDQLRHPHYAPPELLATRPNELWSWDITKLLGPVKWTYYYLYVILDVFSRYTVGWMVAYRESAALAERLISETLARQGIGPDELTIHNDNLSVDPLLCGIYADDYSRCQDSPCQIANNTPGVQIGALDWDCGPCGSPVEERSWGAIKALYR